MAVRKIAVPLDEELVRRVRLADVRGADKSDEQVVEDALAVHLGLRPLDEARETFPVSPSASGIDMDPDIERAAHILAEAAGSPVRVILFGSHARGEAQAGSDLDFLVIEPDVIDRHAEMVRLRGALRGFRRPIDVLVYSEAQVEEWGEAPGTALHAALTEGRVLVEA